MQQFGAELEAGAADQIIESLRPAFDTAAQALAACAELVDPNMDAETFIAGASPDAMAAWRAIDHNVGVVTRISSVVGQFGPHSNSFQLVEIPAPLSAAGFNNNGVMCIDPQFGEEQSCRIFNNPGMHRQSPWFKAASILRLNSIAEARERIRAWAETEWDALGLNQGRGRLDSDKGFVAEPIPNPYALKETVAAEG